MGANRDVRAEMCERGRILTRGLQCSAQGFAGASGDVRAGTVFFKIVGLRKNKGVSLW
jgi:hypothetical protein